MTQLSMTQRLVRGITARNALDDREAQQQAARSKSSALGMLQDALTNRGGRDQALGAAIQAGAIDEAKAFQTIYQGINAQNQSILNKGLIAASSLSGQARNKMLTDLIPYASGNPLLQRELETLPNRPLEEQDTALLGYTMAATRSGEIEAAPKAQKTADQIEREIAIKEQEAATGERLASIKSRDTAIKDEKLSADEKDRALRERQIAVSEAAEQRQATKLSAGLEKALLASQDRVVLAQRNANEYTVLANDFERLNLEGGLKSTFSESLKSILGTQDDVTEFRRKFNQVRLSEGLKNLPPGPATDRDVQEAFKGVPKENASAEQVASFLRGAARLARLEAGYNQFKADFISNKSSAKGLNREWRKLIQSPVLKRKISMAEIYETAQRRGLTPEEVKAKLGIE